MDDDGPPRVEPDNETMQLLRESHAYILTLPPQERHIAAMAAEGAPTWEIAQEMRISDAAVAHVIDRIVAVLSGRAIEQVETGGLGADTDPGASGGYDPEPFGGAGR
ncbi:MAG: LuxR C-terminal-related transcriptional regulator [Chloroflexi bacterium]|nr:LuxR C-terminal-related transcriptional regulator [Chloroflexota bacterium]